MESISLLKNLFKLLEAQRRGQIHYLFVLMAVVSIFEVVSIGAVIPFLAVLLSPEEVFTHDLFFSIDIFGEFARPEDLILVISLGFAFVVTIAGVLRYLMLVALTKFSYSFGSELSVRVFKQAMSRDYATQKLRNSGEIINAISVQTNIVIAGIIRPAFVLISSFFIVGAICCVLIFLNGVISITILVVIGIAYSIVNLINKKKLRRNGGLLASQSSEMLKIVRDGLGGIREVIVNDHFAYFYHSFEKADQEFRRASANNVIISSAPRYVLETVGIIVIVIIAYYLIAIEEADATTLPVLGAIVLGIQRLLPLCQQIYYSHSNILGSQASFAQIMSILEEKNEGSDLGLPSSPIYFNSQIKVIGLGFKYKNSNKKIFSDLNIQIEKGSCVGIVGETGCGKSTLLDLLMGLLKPSEGSISIDGEPLTDGNRHLWLRQIAHVPQDVYLVDSSLAENIAFASRGSNIDVVKLENCIARAQLEELVERLPNGLNSNLGERGAKLSGGEKQRIAIARALYRDAQVLVLDEPTSALDIETERKVISAIQSLQGELTIIIISHRPESLQFCTAIVHVEKESAWLEGSGSKPRSEVIRK